MGAVAGLAPLDPPLFNYDLSVVLSDRYLNQALDNRQSVVFLIIERCLQLP